MKSRFYREGYEMWIVSVDKDYYPYIKKYEKYGEALEEYNEQVETMGSDSCVFLAEVRKYNKSKDYDMEYNSQL
jgi:hypothetical protein